MHEGRDTYLPVFIITDIYDDEAATVFGVIHIFRNYLVVV